jgi:acyl-coenzyme A synthetase/AMP-(fatty) acid ligase
MNVACLIRDAASRHPAAPAVQGASMASFKKPCAMRFLDALPRNAYGKVLRREARDTFYSSVRRSS